MNLSKEEILELRRSRAISAKQARELLADIMSPEAEIEKEDRATIILGDLLKAVRAIKIEEVPLASLEIVLIDIKNKIVELTKVNKELADAKKKTWEFVPVYEGTGRISKITVR